MSELIMGSNQNCHMVISVEGVSGYHAKLTPQGDGIHFLLEDLGSTNGTFVNGAQIFSPTNVTVHDHIFLSANHQLNLSDAIEALYQQSAPFERNPAMNSNRPSNHVQHTGMTKIVGREAPADIVLPYPFISAQHIRVSIQGENLIIEDMSSRNGTVVNGEKLAAHVLHRLQSNDHLFLGTFQVPPYMIREWKMSLEPIQRDQYSHSAIKKPFSLRDGTLTIGRNPSSDIYIEHPTVSWLHATLTIQGSTWTIKDNKSSNGTFVDGSKIRTSLLTPQRKLRIGAVEINLSQSNDAPDMIFDAIDPTKGVRVDTKNLVRVIPDGRRILDDISVSIYPGEMVALMGPSGAGKTTLLNMLTGYKKPSSGTVMYNSLPLWENWDQLRHSIGYVPQEDVMHRDLTVYETLYNAAKLRLPSDSPEQYVKDTVEKLLRDMDLEHTRDTLIGDENTKGISGGQRKRVNIALELITEPPLLFLDEPTSGLDATSTMKTVSLLRKLANEGKTIIMTIHQPRIEVFNQMNNLILLTKGGKLAYFGPTKDVHDYFTGKSSLGTELAENPADYVMDILDPVDPSHLRTPDEWKQDYLQSIYHQKYIVDRQKSSGQSGTVGMVTPLKRSHTSQFFILFQRYCVRKMRDRAALSIQLSQAPIIGILIAWVFSGSWDDMKDLASDREEKFNKISRFEGFSFEFNCKTEGSDVGIECAEMAMEQLQNGIHPSFFLLAAAAFWFGSSNVARELVSERAVYKREKRVGLRSLSYLLSVFAYQALIVTLQVLILIFIVGMALGPIPSSVFLSASVILIMTAFAGISLGLAISAVSKTDVAAISVIPIVLLPQLILSGYVALYLNFESFNKFVAALMPIRWSFSSLLISSYKEICTNKNMGCFCEGGSDNNEVFDEDCLAYEEGGSYGGDYHEGYLLDLEKVIGFADSSSDLTWTINSEFMGMGILLMFTMACLSYSLYTITKNY